MASETTRTTKLSPHIIDLLQMAATGELEPKELAAVLGCSESSVYRLIKEHAGTAQQAAKDVKEALLDMAAQEYQDFTIPVNDILDKFNLSPPTLYNALKSRAVPLRKGRNPERDELIIKMYKNSRYTIFDIEMAANTSTATIYKVLKLNGVPLRRGRNLIELEVIEVL
jgi:AraC-like DNA-binding protein